MLASAACVLVLASRNPKKLRELQELVAPLGISVRMVSEYPGIPEVVEDGDTFAANAAKKAREVARAAGTWALGEDSGLEVRALGGAPGIYSARYSGANATDAANNARLLTDLAGVADKDRGACYACHVAVADPSGVIRLSIERRCHGLITREPRGTNGFGYDPYFLIREYHRTFGELSPLVKRQISHRGRALAELGPALSRLLSVPANS